MFDLFLITNTGFSYRRSNRIECFKYELCAEPGGQNTFYGSKNFSIFSKIWHNALMAKGRHFFPFQKSAIVTLGTARTMLFTNIMHKPTTLILLTTINTRGNVSKV